MRVAVNPEDDGVDSSNTRQRARDAAIDASNAFLLDQRAEAVDGAGIFWISRVLRLEVHFDGIEGMTHDDPGAACEKIVCYFAMAMLSWVRSAVTFF